MSMHQFFQCLAVCLYCGNVESNCMSCWRWLLSHKTKDYRRCNLEMSSRNLSEGVYVGQKLTNKTKVFECIAYEHLLTKSPKFGIELIFLLSEKGIHFINFFRDCSNKIFFHFFRRRDRRVFRYHRFQKVLKVLQEKITLAKFRNRVRGDRLPCSPHSSLPKAQQLLHGCACRIS